jgi:hypothetical protein
VFAHRIVSYLLQAYNDILHGTELRPETSEALVAYMQSQHEHIYGPYQTYFVLGSYDPPFKYRLEIALDELNSRHDAYAYLLAPQPDPDLPDDLPGLKVKFYLHALYATAIPLVLEHNSGGALAEFGRVDRPFLLDRTYVFPRARAEHYDDLAALDSVDDYYARAVELAYHYDGSTLDEKLTELVAHVQAGDVELDESGLEAFLQRELNGRTPSYSGVLTDGFAHFEQLNRCFSWTTEDELRAALDNVP